MSVNTLAPVQPASSSCQSYWLDREQLLATAAKYKQEYVTGNPFPHIVIDNFFPEHVLNGVLQEFPDVFSVDWVRFNSGYEKKLASRSELQFGAGIKHLLHLLNSHIFLEFLQNLTGIDNLISDPWFEGGGLHQIVRGGLLKIHTDFNLHSKTKLDRRLNVLVYLNKDWKEEYGGHFELWDRDMKRAEKKVLPIFNRLVVFSTDDYSYHGHPDPLACPEGMSRKSLALYYYTNGRPKEEINLGIEQHNTLFRLRDDDPVSLRAKDFVKSVTPPIVFDALRKLKNGPKKD